MAYLYSWGGDGNADLRDEWKELAKSMKVGRLNYRGNNEFTWED